MKTCCSYVLVDRDEADKAMRKYIKRILMLRKEKLLKRAKKIEKGFWIFPGKTKRESLQKVMDEKYPEKGWDWICFCGSKWYDMAKEIRKACSVCVSHEIGLTVEQAAFVAENKD